MGGGAYLLFGGEEGADPGGMELVLEETEQENRV